MMKNSGSGPILNWYPLFSAFSNAFLSTPLGSPSYGFPSVVKISHMNLLVPFDSGLHGIVEKVLISGFASKSLSLIEANPATDDPSNNNPSFTISSMSSAFLRGTAILFGNPCMSDSCNFKNFISFASTVLIIWSNFSSFTDIFSHPFLRYCPFW